MGVAFQSAASRGNANGTSHVADKPTGVAVGDLLLAHFTTDTTSNVLNTLSGWTLIAAVGDSAPSDAVNVVYRRLADGSEGSTFTWTSTSSCGSLVTVSRWSGADQTTPVHTSSTLGLSSTSTSLALPSVTTVAANEMLIGFAGVDGDSFQTASLLWTPPSGMTEVYDTKETGSYICHTAAYVEQAGAGASGTKTFTCGINDWLSGVLVAITAAVVAAQDIAPSGIATAAALGTPSIGLQLRPTGVASGEAFGTAVVTPGPVTIAPTGIASAAALGTPTISATIVPVGVASAEAFGTLRIGQQLRPLGIVSGEAFGTLVLAAGAVTIAPTGIASAGAVGTPAIGIFIRPTGIASGAALGTAVVTNLQHIAPTGIVGGEAFGTPTATAPAPGAPVVAPRNAYIGSLYEWEINHSGEDGLQLAFGSHTAPNPVVTVVTQQGSSGTPVLRLQGTALTQDQVDQMEAFYLADQTIVFRHAEGDEYDVVIGAFDAKREAVGANPREPDLRHIWRFSVELHILAVRSGALELVI